MLISRGLKVSAVHVDYGHAARVAERRAVTRVAKLLDVPCDFIRIESRQRFGAGEVVGRNALLIFSVLALARPRFGPIAIGIHKGTPYYDCSTEFLRSISMFVQAHTDSRNQVLAPFAEWTKAQIVDYCRDANIPLQTTYSCERGTTRPCGRCLSCRDRKALGC